MGFSPRGHKESDMTEGTKDAYMHCQKTKLWISSQAESEHLQDVSTASGGRVSCSWKMRAQL